MNAHVLGWAIAVAIGTSLLSTVTNIIPTAGTIAGAAILLMPLTSAVMAVRRLRGLGVYWSVCALIAAMVISGMWYDADQFRCLLFYRYDASLLVVWAPLLLLPVADTMPAALDPNKYVRPWALWCVLVIRRCVDRDLPRPAAHSPAPALGSLSVPRLECGQRGVGNHGGLASRAGVVPAQRDGWWLVLAGLVLLLVGTWSRGSMLGLVCGVAIWWTRRRGWRWLAPMMLAMAIVATGWSIEAGRGHA